jgi:hypothetical protein
LNKDWKVFQTDVLDLIRQYKGFLDTFERVGSLSDNSRPDCFTRVTREEKKEVWILDAKNKPEINEEDEKRMQKYIDQVARNPVDVGLELSELSQHQLRGIFITPENAESEYEVIEFQRLHQFLQKELIYTDTDKIVRDVAKMVERKELSQSQARLLNKSLEPFRNRLEKVQSDLKMLEKEFVGLNLHTPPFKQLNFSPPSDAVIKHSKRNGVFLIDIPYSPKEAKKSQQKAEEIEDRIQEKAYYVSLHNFQSESKYSCPPKKFKQKITEELGILSPETISKIYQPKFEVEKQYKDGYIVHKSDKLGFHLKIESKDDINHKIQASLTPEAINRMKNRCTNSQREFGKFKNKKWNQKIQVTENLNIKHNREETLENYKQTVKNIFQSSVNPVYSKKVAKSIEEK